MGKYFSPSKLRTLRRQAKLTQAKLAAQIGVAENTIGRIERDKERPSRKLHAKIAAALNVEPQALTEDALRPAGESDERRAADMFKRLRPRYRAFVLELLEHLSSL